MKKKLLIVVNIICVICMCLIYSKSYAGFADYTDEQADKQANEQEKEQEKIDSESIGKSSNNYLKSLGIEGYEITPEFDRQTVDYKVTKKVSTTNINIIAEADDERATVTGNGKVQLSSGSNTISVNVKAENGIERTYKVEIEKEVVKEAPTLSSMEVKLKTDGQNSDSPEIEPEFSSDVFEYNCNVENYVNGLEINAISNNENAKVEVEGNTDFKEGNNVVKITVKSEDGENVYKINVNKKAAIQQVNSSNVENNDKKANYYIFIGIVVGIIVILIVIRKIFDKKKKHKSRH